MEKIKVAVRMRPLSKEEKKNKYERSWKMDTEINQISCLQETNYKTTYTFDKLYRSKVSNQEVYEDCARDIVIRALDGIDTTLFVYGQTGAGKTHTMLGNRVDEKSFDGMIFRGLKDIFSEGQKEEDVNLKLTCSYLEIYNEGIYDLLCTKEEDLSKELTIFEDSANNKFVVKGMVRKTITSIKDVEKYLRFGENNRNYAETYFNHKSSRSHTIFSVYIENEKIIKGETAFVKESTVNFVDLAGSERLLYEKKIRTTKEGKDISPRSKTPQSNKLKVHEKERFNESKNINKSLFYLTQVIKMVAKKDAKFVPFRNSPLTKILRSSFGGHSRTLLILCIAPTQMDFDITLSTLRFGRCAKLIENKVKTNIKTDFSQQAFDAIVSSYEQKVTNFHQKLEELEKEHKHHLFLAKDLKKFKAMLADRFLRFHQNSENNKEKLIQKGKADFSFGDLLFPPVGILYTNQNKEEEKLNFCDFCKNGSKLKLGLEIKPPDNTQYDKNQKELWENIEKAEVDLKDCLKNLGIDFDFIYKKLLGISDNYHEFIVKLIKIIHQLRSNLTLYTNEERIRSLETSDLEDMEEEIKKVWEVYYEEKTVRKVKSKYSLDASFADTAQFENLVKVEENLFLEIQEIVEKEIKQFETAFREEEERRLANTDLFQNVKNQINQFLLHSDQERNKLISSFLKIKEEYRKEVYINEKRLNWINKTKQHNNTNLIISEPISLRSSKSLNNIFDKNFVFDKYFFENKELLFYYSMINKKFQTLSKLSLKIQKLKKKGNENLDKNKILKQITGQDEKITKTKKKTHSVIKQEKNSDKNEAGNKSQSKKNKELTSKSLIKEKSLSEIDLTEKLEKPFSKKETGNNPPSKKKKISTNSKSLIKEKSLSEISSEMLDKHSISLTSDHISPSKVDISDFLNKEIKTDNDLNKTLNMSKNKLNEENSFVAELENIKKSNNSNSLKMLPVLTSNSKMVELAKRSKKNRDKD